MTTVVPFETLGGVVNGLQATDEHLVRQTIGGVSSYKRSTPKDTLNFVGPNLPNIPCNRPLAYNFSADSNFKGLAPFPMISIDNQTVSFSLTGKAASGGPQYAAVSSSKLTGGDFTVGGSNNIDRVVAFQLLHTPIIDTTTTSTASNFYKFILQIMDLNNPTNVFPISISSTGNSAGTGNVIVEFPDGNTPIVVPAANYSKGIALTVYVNLETGGIGFILNGVDYGHQLNAAGGQNAVYTLSASNYALAIYGEDSTASTQTYVGKIVSASLVTSYNALGYIPEFATDLNGTWGYVPKDNPMLPVKTIDLTTTVSPLTITTLPNIIDPLNGNTGKASNLTSSTSNSMVLYSGQVSAQMVLIGDATLFTNVASVNDQSYVIIQAGTNNTLVAIAITSPSSIANSANSSSLSNIYTIDPKYVSGTPVLVSVDPITGIITCVTNNGTFVLPTSANNGVSVPLTQPGGAATVITMGISTFLNASSTAASGLTTTIDNVLSGATVLGLTPPTGSVPLAGAVLGTPLIGATPNFSWIAPTTIGSTVCTLSSTALGITCFLVPVTGTISGTPKWLAFGFDTTAYVAAPAYVEGSAKLAFSQNPLPNAPYWFGFDLTLSRSRMNPLAATLNAYGTLVYPSVGGSSVLLDSSNPGTTNQITFYISNKDPSQLQTKYGTNTATASADGIAITFNDQNAAQGNTIVSNILSANSTAFATVQVDTQDLFMMGSNKIAFIIDPAANVLDIVLSNLLESSISFYGTPTGVASTIKQAVLSVPLAGTSIAANQPIYISATAISTNGAKLTLNIQATNNYGINIPASVNPLEFISSYVLPGDLKVGNRLLVTGAGNLKVPNDTNTGSVELQVDQGSVIEVLGLPNANGLPSSIVKYRSDADMLSLVDLSISKVTYNDISNPFPTDGLYAVEAPLALLTPLPANPITSATVAPANPYGTTPAAALNSLPQYARLYPYVAPGSLVRVTNGVPDVLIANAAYDQSAVGGQYPYFDELGTMLSVLPTPYTWNRDLWPAMVNSGASPIVSRDYSPNGMYEFTLGTAVAAAFNATPSYSLAIGIYLPEIPTSATAVSYTHPSDIISTATPTAGSCFVFIDLPSLTVNMRSATLGASVVIGQLTLPTGVTSFEPGDVFTFAIDGSSPIGTFVSIFYNGINISFDDGIVIPNANATAGMALVPGYAPFVYRSGLAVENVQVSINSGHSMFKYCVNESRSYGTNSFPINPMVFPVPMYPAVVTGAPAAGALAAPSTFAFVTNQTITIDTAIDSYVTINNTTAGVNGGFVALTTSNPNAFNSTFVTINNQAAANGICNVVFSGMNDPFMFGTRLSIPIGGSAVYEFRNAATPILIRLDSFQKQSPVATFDGSANFYVAMTDNYDVYPVDLSQAVATTTKNVTIRLPSFLNDPGNAPTAWPMGQFKVVVNQGATPVTGVMFEGAHFPQGQPVVEASPFAITVFSFVVDMYDNIVCIGSTSIQNNTPINVILATTDASLPVDSFLLVNTAPTGPLATFAPGTIVQKKSTVQAVGGSAITSYDPIYVVAGMRINVVSVSTDGSTITAQNDAFGNPGGLIITKNPSASNASNPQLNGTFANYAALGWSTEASYDPAFWKPTFSRVVPTLAAYGTAPATAVSVGDTSAMAFAKTANQSVVFSFPITPDMVTNKPLKLKLRYTADAAANNFDIQLGYQVFGVGSAVNTVSYTDLSETIAAPATVGQLAVATTAVAIIPASALVANDLITCVITRLATNALDTNTGNLQLFDVTVVQ